MSALLELILIFSDGARTDQAHEFQLCVISKAVL